VVRQCRSFDAEGKTVPETSSVALVGAGPGDPELLTVKACRQLREADVVVYDRLVSPAILDLVPAGVQRICAGKACGRHLLSQDEINALLVRLARAGKRVVRLKGGDPFVFGRGSEEALHLAAHGIPFEVVPGITAAAGCLAAAGIPLTHRGMATGVRLITGHARENGEFEIDWRALADPSTTLVVYMALAALERFRDGLVGAGMAPGTPAIAVASGTLPEERHCRTTLAELPEAVAAAGLVAPVLVAVGAVVALGDILGSTAVATGNMDPIEVLQSHG
jgi:uroporphyrin-III C-methyltransferase/precorrin-2 dehydrogenase/sirohydrochlorin ferrochelatase/uroporphyrin-III C-methyltransferase